MHHVIKVSAPHLALRKTAASAVRRALPAWIDSARDFAFPSFATVNGPVTARVRDSLILRPVEIEKSRRSRHSFDVSSGR
jgi:hypothetical protein